MVDYVCAASDCDIGYAMARVCELVIDEGEASGCEHDDMLIDPGCTVVIIVW